MAAVANLSTTLTARAQGDGARIYLKWPRVDSDSSGEELRSATKGKCPKPSLFGHRPCCHGRGHRSIHRRPTLFDHKHSVEAAPGNALFLLRTFGGFGVFLRFFEDFDYAFGIVCRIGLGLTLFVDVFLVLSLQ